ncbi:hypothetical protein HYX04_03930 [Candidatus Woesearchaeota archaeon]|nr:hypothetical protein [Candidatus Woesearchaeota archaeon]
MLGLKTEKQLKNLNLNSYEVKIWSALLSRGKTTAPELSDISNVPRSRSYDVLKSLEKKGFIKIKYEKPISYVAIPPKEALENNKKHAQERAEEEIKKIDGAKNFPFIQELVALHKKGAKSANPAGLSGSLVGRHNLYNHVEYMMKKAEKHILISTTPTEFMNFAEQFMPLFKKLKKKNVDIKISTQLNNQTKKYSDKIRQFAEITNTDNKARFCIVDGKEIIFMVLDDNEAHPAYDVGIWITTPLAKDMGSIYLR